MLIHDRLELEGKDLQRVIPVGGPERSRDRIAQERLGGTVRGGEWGEGFPTFRAGHAQVYRVVRVGGEVDGRAVPQMRVEPAAGGAKAADGGGGGVGNESRGNLAEAEMAGVLDKIGSQRTVELAELGKPARRM